MVNYDKEIITFDCLQKWCTSVISYDLVGFEAPTAMTMKSAILRLVASYSTQIYRRFNPEGPTGPVIRRYPDVSIQKVLPVL
jgi:hypothetical protein